MFLAATPREYRDWEWSHLNALIRRPASAFVTLPSLGVENPRYSAISPDGTELVVLSQGHKYRSKAELVRYRMKNKNNSSPAFDRELIEIKGDGDYRSGPLFTEDGSHLVLMSGTDSRVMAFDGKSTDKLPLSSGKRPVYAFSSTERNVWMAEDYDGRQMVISEVLGEKKRFIASYSFPASLRYQNNGLVSGRLTGDVIDIERDGQIVMVKEVVNPVTPTYYQSNLWLLTADASRDYQPKMLSNNGTSIHAGIHEKWAFSVEDMRLRVWDIATGTEEMDLSPHTTWLGDAGCPLISASGKRILWRNTLCDVVSGEPLMKFPITDWILGFARKSEVLFRIVNREIDGKEALVLEAIVPDPDSSTLAP